MRGLKGTVALSDPAKVWPEILRFGGAQPPQGISFVTTWAALMAPFGTCREADRKICCAGLTRWLNATVPLDQVVGGGVDAKVEKEFAAPRHR